MGVLAVFAALLALVVGLQLSASAMGETKSQQLQSVKNHKDQLAAQLEAHNGEVNKLIGQVSDLRQQEASATEQLAQKQQELEQATAELAAGRDKLTKLRKEFAAASGELKDMLVRIYKAPTPDLGSVLLNSSDIQDFENNSQYYNHLQNYQSSVINRARDLKVQMSDTVAGLADDKQRISDARDQIAARRDALANQRASLEAQEAQLRAARQSRRAMLDRLDKKQINLEDAIQRQAAREAAKQAAEQAATTDSGSSAPAPAPAAPPVSGQTAVLNSDGSASPPAGAPPAVVNAINAANAIRDTPYVWGGGHGSFDSSGYDCSGAVSYALHGGGLLDSPLDSTGLMSWGESGAGQWITVYANSGHAYAVIAGLRWDTSGTGGSGPSWSTSLDGYLDPSAYSVRHPAGL